MSYTTFSEFLHSKYLERKGRNSKYSLRSFSRDMGVSSGRLTNLMKGRDIPGHETIEKFSLILNLCEEEKGKLKSLASSQKYTRRGPGFSKQLTEAEFVKMSDWKTWCVYTLFQASDYTPTYSWFSKKLNLSIEEIQHCLQKLSELELISPVEDFFEIICECVTTTNDIPSHAIRSFHKEFIPLGLSSIDKVKVEERDISSLTICIDKKNIAEYKKALSDFRAKICQLSRQNEIADELYQLNIQLFPMSFQENNL